MEDPGPLCLTCADLDHLIFLPSGDAALTRRARQASKLSAVVVRWSRSRQRYERQGILAVEAAIQQAEEQCLADEDIRLHRRERDRERRANEDVQFQARMAGEIRRLYPGCPEKRATAIAAHAALRGSGRVGRSASPSFRARRSAMTPSLSSFSSRSRSFASRSRALSACSAPGSPPTPRI